MQSKILQGPPSLDDPSKGCKSLGEFIVKNLRNAGNETVIVDALTDEETTAFEFLQKIIHIAKCLEFHGIVPGDRVAIYSENNVNGACVLFGSIVLGAAANPISSYFTEIELNNSLRLSMPKILFVSSKNADNVLNIANENPSIEHIFVFGDDHPHYPHFDRFLETVDIPNVDDFVCEPQDIAENVALVVAASGTSGMPKGVQITQLSLFGAMEFHPPLPAITPSPFSYMTGFSAILGTVSQGVKCYILSQLEPEIYFHCIEKYQLSVIFLSQTYLNYLVKNSLASKFDLSHVKYMSFAGAALSRRNYDIVSEKYPNAILFQCYGSTEGGMVCGPGPTTPPESVGVIAKGCTGKIVDPQTDEILGPNEHGEIRVKSNRIMKGYIGDIKATVEAFDADGFLCTGDIAYYDKNGNIYIVDRIKELIKYCGKQVYPNEIEFILIAHQSVQEVCVIGLPDEECGELPLAIIVRNDDVTEDALIAYVAEKLSDPQHLRGGVIFVSALPQLSSGSGKIARKRLKEMAINMKLNK